MHLVQEPWLRPLQRTRRFSLWKRHVGEVLHATFPPWNIGANKDLAIQREEAVLGQLVPVLHPHHFFRANGHIDHFCFSSHGISNGDIHPLPSKAAEDVGGIEMVPIGQDFKGPVPIWIAKCRLVHIFHVQL